MGEKNVFAPKIIRRKFFNFVYLKKRNMKESRNRDNNTKKTEYILNERCKFCKKKLSMTKKRSSEILEIIEENFVKIFCLKINFPKIFAPPNIYDKSTRCSAGPSSTFGCPSCWGLSKF